MTTESTPDDGAHASRRTWALVVALTTTSLTVLTLAWPTFEFHQSHLAWWAIAAIAFVSPLCEFEVEFRRESGTFTFSEVALLVGLFLASPAHMIIGRLLGEVLFLAVRQRQPLKIALNMASYLVETVALLVVFHTLVGAPDPRSPLHAAVALVAVAIANGAGYTIIVTVLRWHGEPVGWRSVAFVGLVTVPVNTCFALLYCVLAAREPWATALLLGVGAVIVVLYRSYTRLRQRYEGLELLYEFTRLTGGVDRPDEVLEAMLVKAKDLLRADHAEIWLHGGAIHLRVDDDGSSVPEPSDDRSAAAAAWCRRDGSVARLAVGSGPWSELASALSERDCIVAPVTASGQVIGLLAVSDRLGDGNRFDNDDRTVFATLAGHASVAIENGTLVDRLTRQALEREFESTHDRLTSLPNRAAFADALHDAIEAGACAVAVMDLDGFSEINATLGHEAGDAVLVELARRLSQGIDPGMTVARLGGDEFGVLAPGRHESTELTALAWRIRHDLARPFAVGGVSINATVSIGIAAAPGDAGDAATLLQRADVAVSSAKSGSGVDAYDAVRDENSPRRLALANELRLAIAAGQLALVYQPKASISTGDIVGFEALVRWTHPEFGPVYPDEFIPLAERTGVIDDLTAFVLRSALDQTARWHADGHQWGVSVNVAMRNLVAEGFVQTVRDALWDTRCPARSVTLEITETSVMADPSRTMDVLERLAWSGVALSVDDFGTGYSSLSYLQQLPVSEIKIDKCFVSPMCESASAAAIVRSVLDLATSLDLKVVAEGIEDADTWAALADLGCDVAQGYLLSKPIPACDVEAWVAAWQPPSAAVATGQ